MNALPYNLRVDTKVNFPSLVAGASGIKITKSNGIWTVKLDFNSFQQLTTIPDPANTYVMAYNVLTGVASLVQVSAVVSAKSIITLTSGSAYTAQPSDEVILVKSLPMAITVDWSARTKALRVVDALGSASANNITITPKAGQTQMASVNYVYRIDGNGGSITLTPLPDGSGAY
jgi:hypothetical protein